MVFGEQDNKEEFCGLMLWWSCALVSVVLPLRGLEKKIALQRFGILDAYEQWTELT